MASFSSILARGSSPSTTIGLEAEPVRPGPSVGLEVVFVGGGGGGGGGGGAGVLDLRLSGGRGRRVVSPQTLTGSDIGRRPDDDPYCITPTEPWHANLTS